MKFSIHGPFDLPRENGLIDSSAHSKRVFWKQVEECVPGLSDACGCYVFVLKAGRGALPWYVGLTQKNTFRGEAIGSHQVSHYDRALAGKTRSKAQLFFIAKQTPTERFANGEFPARRGVSRDLHVRHGHQKEPEAPKRKEHAVPQEP